MTRREKKDTGTELIEATLDALRELRPVDLISAVGVREIARRAGVSGATLYNYFASVEELAEAVVGRLYDPRRSTANAAADLIDDLRKSSLPGETGKAVHHAEFQRISTDPEFRLRMGVWALGGAATDVAYRDFLRTIDDRIADFTRLLFDSWGRELRPPYDIESFIALQVALVNGSSVRHLLEPDLVDVEKFSRAAISLTMVSLRVRGDHRTLDDRLAEMNYYPLKRSPSGAPSEKRLQTRAMILDVAAGIFGARDYEELTMSQLARAAGVGISTLYDYFGNTGEVADQLFRAQASDLLSRTTLDAEDPLEDYLGVVAGFAAARVTYAKPYLAGLASAEPGSPDPVLGFLTGPVASAQSHGRLPDGLPADEVARSLLTLVLSRLQSHPAEGPAGAVEFVARLSLKP